MTICYDIDLGFFEGGSLVVYYGYWIIQKGYTWGFSEKSLTSASTAFPIHFIF